MIWLNGTTKRCMCHLNKEGDVCAIFLVNKGYVVCILKIKGVSVSPW